MLSTTPTPTSTPALTPASTPASTPTSILSPTTPSTEGNNNENNIVKLHSVQSAADNIRNSYCNTQSLATSLLGQVLMGTHIKSGRTDCIKICLKEMHKSFCDRIAENPSIEIAAMEAVCTHKHPYIVQLIDTFEDSKLYVTISEFVSNGDMCTYLQKLGHGLPLPQVRKYYKQLVEAVSFMHDKGYCHLDISLENILIDKANDCIKLCDFGLSRPISHHKKSFPVSCIRPGKMGYIAPEIVSYQSFSGDKADAFSLGVVLFMFLTGFPPFRIASVKDACFKYFYFGYLERLLTEWKLLDIIPLDAQDLLSRLLIKSDKRISVDDILNHPFLQTNDYNTNTGNEIREIIGSKNLINDNNNITSNIHNGDNFQTSAISGNEIVENNDNNNHKITVNEQANNNINAGNIIKSNHKHRNGIKIHYDDSNDNNNENNNHNDNIRKRSISLQMTNSQTQSSSEGLIEQTEQSSVGNNNCHSHDHLRRLSENDKNYTIETNTMFTECKQQESPIPNNVTMSTFTTNNDNSASITTSSEIHLISTNNNAQSIP